MTDVLDGVRDHYRATGLTERLKTALTALGPEDRQLTPQQLGALDQFHVRGLAATAELAQLVGITAAMSILDVGSGVGGPARFLAATYRSEENTSEFQSHSFISYAVFCFKKKSLEPCLVSAYVRHMLEPRHVGCGIR